MEEEAAILNEEAEAIAREEETSNNDDLITSSPADSPLADESCVVEASTVSPYDLSADGMCIVDAATIDDLSIDRFYKLVVQPKRIEAGSKSHISSWISPK